MEVEEALFQFKNKRQLHYGSSLMARTPSFSDELPKGAEPTWTNSKRSGCTSTARGKRRRSPSPPIDRTPSPPPLPIASSSSSRNRKSIKLCQEVDRVLCRLDCHDGGSPEETEDPLEFDETFTLRVFFKGKLLKLNVRKSDSADHVANLVALDARSGEGVTLLFNSNIMEGSATLEGLGVSTADILDAVVMPRKQPEKTVDPTVCITVQGASKRKKYIIKKMDPFVKAMDAFSSLVDVPVSKLRFMFDGNPISPEQCVNDLEIEGGDVIDCVVIEKEIDREFFTLSSVYTPAFAQDPVLSDIERLEADWEVFFTVGEKLLGVSDFGKKVKDWSAKSSPVKASKFNSFLAGKVSPPTWQNRNGQQYHYPSNNLLFQVCGVASNTKKAIPSFCCILERMLISRRCDLPNYCYSNLLTTSQQYCIRACVTAGGHSSTHSTWVLDGVEGYVDVVMDVMKRASLPQMLSSGSEHTVAVPLLCNTVSPGEAYPEYWEPQSSRVELKPVDPNSEEWSSVCTLVRRTLPQVGLVSLERIQNKWLWDRYYFAKERMHEKNKGLINEKWLFHGTRQNPPERIYRSEQGFDFRFSRQGAWGLGTYFAVNASYSHGYAHVNGAVRQMILASVLTGDSYCSRPNQTLRTPPVKAYESEDGLIMDVMFDSVTGYSGNSQIFVIYDHEKAYPSYLISYA